MEHAFHTLAERPDARARVTELHREAWPTFVRMDAVAVRHWPALFERFGEFQFVLSDTAGDVLAVGNTVPLSWDGTVGGLPAGWDGALLRAVEGAGPDTLCALAAVVAPEHRGRGLSSLILGEMTRLAARHGFGDLIAPVRPTLKSRYPLAPMARYVEWRCADGLPFDPWIRVHARLGAEPLAVAERSMFVTGTVADWEAWTGMRFPETGDYVVPGALRPVAVDCERDAVEYGEPNFWMRHTVEVPADAER